MTTQVETAEVKKAAIVLDEAGRQHVEVTEKFTFRTTERFSLDGNDEKVDSFNPKFQYVSHDANGNRIAKFDAETKKELPETAKFVKKVKDGEVELIKRADLTVKIRYPLLSAFGIDATFDVLENGVKYHDAAMQLVFESICANVSDEARGLIDEGQDVTPEATNFWAIAAKPKMSRKRGSTAVSAEDIKKFCELFTDVQKALGKQAAMIALQVRQFKARCRDCVAMPKPTLEAMLRNVVHTFQQIPESEKPDYTAAAEFLASQLDAAIKTDIASQL